MTQRFKEKKARTDVVTLWKCVTYFYRKNIILHFLEGYLSLNVIQRLYLLTGLAAT